MMEADGVTGKPRPELSADVAMAAEGCVEESGGIGGDPVSLFAEMDSFWDDLNARLVVLRMVNDSIIKGMVSAVQEEAAEEMALKEAEIAVLGEKLQGYESSFQKQCAVMVNFEPSNQEVELLQCSSDASEKLEFVGQLNRLTSSAERQFQRLDDREPVDVGCEQQGDQCIRSGIGGSICQSLTKSIKDEFETMISEQQTLLSTLSQNWKNMIEEISSMHQDLKAGQSSLSSLDPGVALLQKNIDKIDEGNGGNKKDIVAQKMMGNHFSSMSSRQSQNNSNNHMEKSEESGEVVPNDSPQLKCMKKEELIVYFRTEMNKMKRQHEIELHEKTEELFSLKRGLLKEKGPSALHFSCREKDFEMMKKKISDLIFKLDHILLENKVLPLRWENENISCRLRERINTFCLENEWLQQFLADKSNKARYISRKSNLTEEIERLHLANAEVQTEATIKEEKYKSALEDLVKEIESEKEGLETATRIIEDNYRIIYCGVLGDALSSIRPIIVNSFKEKDYINEELVEMKKALSMEVEEKKRLKEEMASLSDLVKENEKSELEFVSEMLKQQEQFDSVCHDLNVSRDQLSEQEMIISKTKKELELLNCNLNEALLIIHQKESEISNLNQKYMATSKDLEEMKEQNGILHSTVQEKHEKLVFVMKKDNEQKQQLKFIVVSVTELSKTMWDFGCRLRQKLETFDSRIDILSHQCIQIKPQCHLLKRQVSWYKARYEARCQDLQKAEIEVDLLGDEVDTLLGLLGKIYMALDHYSPVLQHYPGVVETLKLIRREMDEENAKPT